MIAFKHIEVLRFAVDERLTARLNAIRDLFKKNVTSIAQLGGRILGTPYLTVFPSAFFASLYLRRWRLSRQKEQKDAVLSNFDYR